MTPVPSLRLTRGNGARADKSRKFVLYWMRASRRRGHNFALARAVEIAKELEKPLVVLEALRCDHRWASDRFHRFVLDGMRANESAFADGEAFYWPYVEPEASAGKGLLQALSAHACAVVTDEYPCFMLPRMAAAAARQIDVVLELVDGNGLLPLRAGNGVPIRAYLFRRLLQKALPVHLAARPAADPLAGALLPRLDALPRAIEKRWPRASAELLAGSSEQLALLPIDHSVAPVEAMPGGSATGHTRLERFLDQALSRYPERSHPDADASSGLSPYLHFGHLGVHEILHELAARERWTPAKVGSEVTGSASGWWGMSAGAESFVDQLVTWRELGFQACHFDPSGYDRFDSLPAWAQRTLEAHREDSREHEYSLAEFAAARTHDPLWNAAQTQLLREGTIQNYLRMLWGKKILEWSSTPQAALTTMIELNNRYAIDGRDPNSYTGILWCLGKYDRPWGPEREVYGLIRYMSSANTKRKLDLDLYLAKWAPSAQRGLFG